MLDAFKEEQIVEKVGGRFKLSALIQKRLVALNRGAPRLVETPTNDLMEVVVREIMEDKIYLDEKGDVRVFGDAPVQDDQGPSLADIKPDQVEG